MLCDISYPSFYSHRLHLQRFSPKTRLRLAYHIYLRNFSDSEGRITISFAFRDDILEAPIFQRSTRSMNGVHVNPLKAIPVNSIPYWTKRLGERAGLDHPFQL